MLSKIGVCRCIYNWCHDVTLLVFQGEPAHMTKKDVTKLHKILSKASLVSHLM